MATRSNIWIQIDENTFKGIYCHWDGYIESNGEILFNHYNDRDKVLKLIQLGDISSLAENIGTKHDFYKFPEDECNVYHRDREEKYNQFIENSIDPSILCREEYAYLYTLDNEWLVSKYKRKFIPLEKALEKEK